MTSSQQFLLAVYLVGVVVALVSAIDAIRKNAHGDPWIEDIKEDDRLRLLAATLVMVFAIFWPVVIMYTTFRDLGFLLGVAAAFLAGRLRAVGRKLERRDG